MKERKYRITQYGPSQAIAGQALRPAELLKRHLAGTLPAIDLSSKYEFYFDENGKRVGEPLPIELHEVHRLSVAIREEQYKLALEHRQKKLDEHKQRIIDEYLKTHPEIVAKPPAEGGKPA